MQGFKVCLQELLLPGIESRPSRDFCILGFKIGVQGIEQTRPQCPVKGAVAVTKN